MFLPIEKEIAGLTGEHVSHRQYLIVDVEAIVCPISVVPDLGGPPNAYLQVKRRKLWKSDFQKWLEVPVPDSSFYDSDEDSISDSGHKNFESDPASGSDA